MTNNNKQDERSIGDNSFANKDYEDILQQAVKLLGRFNHYAAAAGYEISRAINGKNSTVRAVGARDAEIWLRKLKKESESWDTVIRNMEDGKDIHLQDNCKSEKLDIAGGFESEFGQYIINKSSPKFSKENKDGRDYMSKVNAR